MRTRQTFWFRNRTRSTAPSISSFGSRGPMAAEPASSSAPTLLGCQALEQFLLLAKTARGASVHELIRQATAAPGVYVFGELLETDCVRELEGGNSAEFVRLLELFAFGTYSDYKSGHVCSGVGSLSHHLVLTHVPLPRPELTASLPALSPAQIRKLKHLTIVSLAAKSKVGLGGSCCLLCCSVVLASALVICACSPPPPPRRLFPTPRCSWSWTSET